MHDKMMFKLFFVVLALLPSLSGNAQGRSEMELNVWDFSRDGLSWEQVTVPHDWAIGGPFDKKWDLQVVAIEQNGEKEKSEKTGRSGALPWIGEGHYRTTVALAEVPEHAELVFDGAMSESVVTVNGHEAGRWAYGYNAFRIDVTPYIFIGENTICVDLKNVEESSRWYPGGGLYRPVKLVTTARTHIDAWSTYIRTTTLDNGKGGAELDCETRIENIYPSKRLRLWWHLVDPSGKTVSTIDSPVSKSGLAHQRFYIKTTKAELWTPETPHLYRVELRLWEEGSGDIDRQVVKTGLRTVRVTRESGFQLNGQTRKLKGVCLHHDLGPLGAAVNKAALIRQVKILKDMGCDAIRTAHNMPSTMQMEVYDSLGMMVMAESFDMWLYPKCKNGYARFFRDWADKDISNLVLNHRNHPSLVMWSIGNEIPEQWSDRGRQISIRLQGICHSLDPSRPVTQGMDRAEEALSSGFAQVMDVPGFNYRVHKYAKSIGQLPQGFLLGSETASTVSSRGVYKFPVEFSDNKVYEDGQCSSYDTEYCPWSNLPDDDFAAMDDLPYTIGQFVWTGFDYLGEPTPYDGYWPSRSSYFGICDLAGLPKDRYYLYRSVWNKDEHTIHLLPHWTWPERKGKQTPVYCYTDFPTAELFVNGKSQGKISKDSTSRYDRYRLRWNDVIYEPGELKVVVYDEQDQKKGEQTIMTAGKAKALKMEVWTQHDGWLAADGTDLAYVTVSVVDKNGTEIPYVQDQLEFQVLGAGQFLAVCNGDATSLESFTRPTMRMFSGKVVATVKAADLPGTMTLRVKDKTNRGLSGEVQIPVK